MKQKQIDGYVLHTRKFGDTSLIVDVLRSDDSRESFLCQGVNRPKSRFAGLLRPFCELSINYRQRNGMPLVTEVSTCTSPPFPNPNALYCGFYLNELLVYLLKANDAHDGVYELYRWAIQTLKCAPQIEPVLRSFEKHLLALLGYGMELEREVMSGSSVQSDLWYDYQLELGPVACTELEKGAVPGYRVSGACLHALATNDLSGSELAEAKGLLRYVLNHYLDGRRLRSRDLFRSTKP